MCAFRMKYYYLVASLPLPVLGDPPPMTVEDFCTRSATVLEEEDRRELDLVLEGRSGEGASTFARKWHALDTQIRNALARVRAGRRSVDAAAYLRDHEGFVVSIEKAVTDAYTKPNPMETERAIDRCRWTLLNDLAREEPFGLSAVLSFAVRLQIASRWAGLVIETGGQRVDELIEDNLEEEGSLLKDEELTRR